MNKAQIRTLPIGNPAFVTLLLMSLLVGAVILGAHGDPLALARLGTRFSLGDPNGTQGYDGQFVYYIARDPRPEAVASLLDDPAYRYQRILLPLLGWVLSLGNVQALPWVLALIGILSQVAGTWIVGEILATWGVSRWYALIYGLWVGFSLAVRLDLPEPLAYALVAGGILATERRKPKLAWILYGLALFAKDVTAIFAVSAGLAFLLQRRWRDALALGLVAGLPYLLFQGWLWSVFGHPGLGSGNAMEISFEVIPLMGLLRIGFFSPLYLLAMLVVFGPSVIAPALWGLWVSLKRLLSKETNVVVLAVLLNSLAIVFLPFIIFRETGGLLRFACGLILALLLFAARYRYLKILNYGFLWIILNVFLLKT